MIGEFLLKIFADEITFHAVNNFNFLAGLGEFFGSLRGVREGLNNSMVGNCDGVPIPIGGGLNQFFDGDNGVHCAHRRMNV